MVMKNKDKIKANASQSNRDRLLADIEAETRKGMGNYEFANRMSAGKSGLEMSSSARDQMMNEVYTSQNNVNKLKGLLESYDSSGSGGAEQWSNPFGAGGSGGAPTMSTSNRFEAGLSDAESRLRSLLDNPDSINKSAAYKFRVKQGEEAINRQLGARGMLNSGNRLMELTKYGQDMGSQEYDAQAGRLSNLLGNYSQSWLGDKNANTAAFGAQSGAWNTAQANADRNRLGWATLDWEKKKPQGGGAVIRTSGGQQQPLYQSSPSTPIDPWSYNMGSYDGTNSWYTHDKTGAQMSRKMG